MTYKNSFSGWKSVFRSNLLWNSGELRSICSAGWSSWSDSADCWLGSFFTEMLIHSLVNSARVVFCDCFENEKLTRFPSYLNELVATEISLICVLFALQRANFAINSHVGGLRCFKSRKPEDRLGCQRLLEIACGACIGHWTKRSAQERNPFLSDKKPKLIRIELIGSFYVQFF